MRTAVAVTVAALAGCRAAPPVSPRPAPAPTAAEVIARSHAILEAFDRGDVDAIRPVLAPSYVRFEGSIVDRDAELGSLAKRKPDTPHVASRAWSDERTFVGQHAATFIGKAREQSSGNEVHGGGYIYDGWYTLEWVRDGDDWKLVYWGWKPAGAAAQSAAWNQIYKNAVGFNREPNRLLTTAITGVTPGDALDIAMGQGRNALYLAGHGWKVTGIDIADEGLQQAREAAQRAKLSIDAINADVKTFDLGRDRWDLVTLIYAPAAKERIPDIQRSVRRGGLVVYEYFAPETEDDDDAFAPGKLAKQFAGWEILRDEIVEDVPDWALNRAKVQRFVARKK